MAKVFGAASTTNDVLERVDLTGKRVLVTGVSAGLGVETARALAARGAWIVGAARDLAKAQRATQVVRNDAAKGGGIELVELDLASLASVRSCADKLNAEGKPIDVVIANAGIMACPKGKTVDGFEIQFGTNHLGHFVLVNRIAPLIRERFISLSSSGHKASDVDLDDPNYERTPYTAFGAYGRSKTANSLFAVEFDRRHKGRGVRAAAVHPGAIPTELSRHINAEVMAEIAEMTRKAMESGATPERPPAKTPEQGAATSVWAAFVAPIDIIGGRFCEDCHVAEINNEPAKAHGVCAYAVDPARAQALWVKSEELVGECF
jgi:NAD(P)-dependent dehydrogenase (short-subunit alcohol dehydrogenase family)